MRRKSLSFRDKLLALGVSLTAGSLLLFGAVMWWNNHQLREVAYTGCLRAAEADLDHIAESIDRLCLNNLQSFPDKRPHCGGIVDKRSHCGGIVRRSGVA